MTSLHNTELERLRLACIRNVMPKGRSTLLDVGTRDGWLALSLLPNFERVVAVDRSRLDISAPVLPVQADAVCLAFKDGSFDTVLCAEVLEHIPAPRLERACREIARVARYDVIIGTPYRQDIRVGRATCQDCGTVNPPWGHVNSFDESRLYKLFSPLVPTLTQLVGSAVERTNRLSTVLMDKGANPWGTYGEACINCGGVLTAQTRRSLRQRVCSKAAHLLSRLQNTFSRPRPVWIYVVFSKHEFGSRVL